MFQSCLLMSLTGVLPTWKGTILSAWCSAYRSGKRIKFPGFRFHPVIVCGKAKNKTWTGCWHDPSGNAGMPGTEKCHPTLWQLVYEKPTGVHPWRISEFGHNWECTGRFCPVWVVTGMDRMKRQTGRTWKTALHWNWFFVPGRRRYPPWTGSEVHGWNIFLCSFMGYGGT